jgi:hypothetical protein
MLQRFSPQLASVPLPQLFAANNIPVINEQLQIAAIISEVYQGIFLIVELLLPSRNIVFIYLWWQYLRMRVMMDQSGKMKKVFGDLDTKINQLLSNQ